eukprot:g18213.t1
MLLSSSLGSLVVCAVCWAFLYLQWSVCCSCQRPLRWWLLLYATLQQLQLPVRFVTLYRLGLRLQLHEADGERLQVEVSRFTSSMAWRWSKNISLFTYGWFVLGIVWVLNSDYEITIAVIGQAFLRAVGAMLCFRLCMQAQPADSPKVEAARADEIASLPVVAFRSEMAKEHAMCSVCLSDYVEGEALRRLPCGHLFHRRCADEWLHRSCRCPLCVQTYEPWRLEWTRGVQRRQRSISTSGAAVGGAAFQRAFLLAAGLRGAFFGQDWGVETSTSWVKPKITELQMPGAALTAAKISENGIISQ